MPLQQTESHEPQIIYTYYRDGEKFVTPSIDFAFQRNDGVYDVTYKEIRLGDVEPS